jgi:hypothetical protein
MKLIIAAALLTAGTVAANAQNYGNSYSYGSGSNSSSHSVQGHYNNSGTYTQPYQATNPNSTQYDNYSSRGNTNPYTGMTGTRSPRY